MNTENYWQFTTHQIANLAEVPKTLVHKLIDQNQIQPINNDILNKRYSLEDTRNIVFSLANQGAIPLIERSTQVFYNFKGGTGKSTISSQIASQLAVMGYNVLAVDLDPQAHMTLNLGFMSDQPVPSMYEVLINGTSVEEVIQPLYEGLWLIPANLKMTRVEVPLSQKTRREELLKRILEPLEKAFDYIIIDTNPTFSILNVNALVCADQINIVSATHPLSYHGLSILLDDLESLLQEMDLSIPYSILPNLYEAKTVTAQEILGAIQSEYEHIAMKTVVRKSEDLNLASKYGLPVCTFAKKRSAALVDILELTREILATSQQPYGKPTIKSKSSNQMSIKN